jgi:Glycoside Hydrolase Family 113
MATACRHGVPSRLAAVATLTLLTACGGGGSPSTPTPTPPPGGAGFTYNGITHVSWWHDEYGYPAASTSRSALASTGAGWAGLLVTWYMDTKSSNTIAAHPDQSNDDDVVRRAIDEMHALGLKVMLKPHVDVRDGTWRAQIAPTDPGLWFESYTAFMDHYVAIAAEKNVAMLCIGTELASMSGSGYAAQWASLIARIRSRYAGLLTYAANGVEAADEFTGVAFWSQVDLLGADVYTPLTDKTNPTRAELVAGWRKNRYGYDMVAAFSNLQKAYGKPLIFTEIGYRSGDGTNRTPWDWGASMAVDTAEQADCYAALYEVWSKETAWMKGPFWWAWDVSPPAAGDTGYNPRGKAAEDVLRQWQK